MDNDLSNWLTFFEPTFGTVNEQTCWFTFFEPAFCNCVIEQTCFLLK